jgi:aspartate 4-decarboxylase
MLALTDPRGSHLAKLSPFELKDELIKLAQAANAQGAATTPFLNAGRGNPNWIATTPREAFVRLTEFALSECKRDWDEPGLGGMPQRAGIAGRLREFMAKEGAGNAGTRLLAASLDYGVNLLGFDADAWIHELADGIIGDNYPVPGRMLVHCERVVHAFLAKEMFAGCPATGRFDLFAVEGGTAAMCYLFNSLRINKLLKAGDTIALGTPIFTPYIEMTHLEGFRVVNVEQAGMKDGIHTWRYTEAELKKLENPKVKAFFVCNPSNPASVAIDDDAVKRIARLVKTRRPDLIVLTDDVYGTFVDNFRSLAAEIPQNTILVYSYSKHFGCTGWRLGVIAMHEKNIIDRKLAKLPKAQQRELTHRYGSLTLEPLKMKFIDRMVADSRNVALNHTAGLSLPQQVQMTLFSLFALLDHNDAYKKRCQTIVQQRLQKLVDGLKLQLPQDDHRAAYYAVLDIEAWARRTHGDEFMEWATANHVPLDIVFGLARNFGTVLLNGDGFGGPPWSARVSLANLSTNSYLAIGESVAAIAARAVQRFEEWKKQGKPAGKRNGASKGKATVKSKGKAKARKRT